MEAVQEKNLLIINFLNNLAEWNFTSAVTSADLIDDFPRRAYYHVESLSNCFDNLGIGLRKGTAFSQISTSVHTIILMLEPWIISNFGKEERKYKCEPCETFCSLYK